MKKETITERVKGLLFANAECAELCRLDAKFKEMDEKERAGLERIAKNSEQKILVLLEVLGSRVGDKIVSDGVWSARERFAKWHNLDKYKIAGL